MRILLLTGLLLLPTLLFAAPGVPHQLHGKVSNLTSGTISAVIDGVIVGSASIQSDGSFGKAPHFFYIEDANGVFSGKTMTFKIGGSAPATGSVIFKNGGFTEIVSELVIIGGGGSTLPPAPVVVSAPAPVVVQNIFDLTGDGVVDILDFNLFMAHWGSTEIDFNRDGVVDILDFNLFMANWS